MSNTNKVPSAEDVFKEIFFGDPSPEFFKALIEAMMTDEQYALLLKSMREHTRLHLEAMRDEIINTQYGPTRESINYIANTYIKNNKL